MNKYRFTIPENDGYINIPLEIKWDFQGREDSIELFEEDVIEEVVGKPKDYEILRFTHNSYNKGLNTDINYQFYFYSGDPTTFNTSKVSDWGTSYITQGYTTRQIYFFENPFTKSFFKLDFYDTNDTLTQTLYFTIILPVQQGDYEMASISPIFPNVKIRKPKFKLDFLGDTEGFYIYWLRDRETLDISTFYMAAKFFNARKGGFVKMMNAPQASLPNSKYLFDESTYFYYKVTLDYQNKSYSVFNTNSLRIGSEQTPIKWYEFINQP